MLYVHDFLDVDARTVQGRRVLRQHLKSLEEQPPEAILALGHEFLRIIQTSDEPLVRRSNAATVLVNRWKQFSGCISINLPVFFSAVVEREIQDLEKRGISLSHPLDMLLVKTLLAYVVQLRPADASGTPERIRDATSGTEFSTWVAKLIEQHKRRRQ